MLTCPSATFVKLLSFFCLIIYCDNVLCQQVYKEAVPYERYHNGKTENAKTYMTVSSFAAPFDDPGFPFSIVDITSETPEWAVRLYAAKPNIFKIKSLFDQWRKDHPYIKNEHTQNFKKLYSYVIEHRALDAEGYIDPSQLLDHLSLEETLINKRKTFSKRKDRLKSSNNTEWQALGPYRMEENDGLPTNRHINIYALDQSRSHPNILYCASESGGTIYKTTDKGDNWFSVSDSLVYSMGYRELEISPKTPDEVYLGVEYRILKTVDGGSNWSEVYAPGGGVSSASIIIHPTQTDTVLAGTRNGIVKTVDGGNSWNVVSEPHFVYDLRFNPSNPDIVYALMDDPNDLQTYFYKSVDGGDSWAKISQGWPSEISNGNIGGRMTTSEGHPNIIFAFIGAQWVGTSGKDRIKVMKSSNGGESWKTIVNYDDSGGINSGQGYYDWDIEMSDVDSNLVFLGTQSKWVTTDGFESKTYNIGISDLGHADVQEVLFNGSDLWVANDGGIIKFDDETFQNYEVKSNGIDAISFWSFDHGWNRDAQVGTHYHNGTSVRTDTYKPGVYLNHGGAEPSFSLLSAPNADKMVSKGYGSVNGKILHDDQLEKTVNFNYNIVPNQNGYDGTSMTTSLTASQTNFVGLADSVMRSDDFGKSWRSISGFTYDDEYVRGISLSRAADSVMYVITDHSNGGLLYRSDDMGDNFSTLTLPDGFSLANAEISVSNEDSDILFIGGDNILSGPDIRIVKTEDGGVTWTDLWTNTLSGYNFRKLLHVDGTDGGVYILATRGVFYRNNTMSDWEPLLEGIPPNASLQYMKPFYKESKIRIAGSRGVYSADLFDTPVLSDNLIQPISRKSKYECSRDTIYFDDYSVLNHNGADWSWSFPGATFVSDANIRNPKVVYRSSGAYDVTLTVTQDGRTYSKTVKNMVNIGTGCDQADVVPGEAMSFDKTGEGRLETEDFNLTTNTLTITAWMKPEGVQDAFAGIVSNGVWCAHCNDKTLGIIWNYWAGHLYYRWPNSTSSWAGRSSLAPVSDEWSYVALVMSPDSVMMYLNDERWVQYIEHEPANISFLNIGKGHYSKYFNGLIDEVAIWKRSLTDREIKEQMHLTKNPEEDPDLIAYYQFNEDNGLAINKSGAYHASLINTSERIESSAPIGGGYSSSKFEEVDMIQFGATGVEMDYQMESGAEVVVSRINLSPSTKPSQIPRLMDGQYWAIHRYGEGIFKGDISFSIADQLSLSDVGSPSQIVLFGRSVFSDDPWEVIDTADIVSYGQRKITFEGIEGYSQFLIGALDDGLDTDCLRDVQVENTSILPLEIGSSNYVHAGNINGFGDVSIQGSKSYLFKASEEVGLFKGFATSNGAVLTIQMVDCTN